jgi:hypothetical protein
MRGVQTTLTDPFCMPNRRVAMVHCEGIVIRPIINNLHTYKLNEGRLRLRVTPIAVKRLCCVIDCRTRTASQAAEGEVPVGRGKRMTLPGK